MNTPEYHPRCHSLRCLDQILDYAGIVTKRCMHCVDVGQEALDTSLFLAERAAKAEVSCDYLMSARLVTPVPDIGVEAFDKCFWTFDHVDEATGLIWRPQRH